MSAGSTLSPNDIEECVEWALRLAGAPGKRTLLVLSARPEMTVTCIRRSLEVRGVPFEMPGLLHATRLASGATLIVHDWSSPASDAQLRSIELDGAFALDAAVPSARVQMVVSRLRAPGGERQVQFVGDAARRSHDFHLRVAERSDGRWEIEMHAADDAARPGELLAASRLVPSGHLLEVLRWLVVNEVAVRLSVDAPEASRWRP